jgi:hypothetical protein
VSSFWESKLGKAIDRVLPIGPRSVLFGAHCFFLHPFFVAAAWIRLYGIPKELPIWVSFMVHDLGYAAQWCRGMDNPEDGEKHPEFGAWLMHLLFDEHVYIGRSDISSKKWFEFTLYHSRYYAKKHGVTPSKLCAADKLAYTLTPWWIFIPMTRLTGEIQGYMDLSKLRAEAGEPVFTPARNSHDPQKRWYFQIQEYSERWAYAFKDGGPDTWTPEAPHA